MVLGVLDTPSAWVLWEGDNNPWGATWAHGFCWTATFCCAVSVTPPSCAAARAACRTEEIQNPKYYDNSYRILK